MYERAQYITIIAEATTETVSIANTGRISNGAYIGL